MRVESFRDLKAAIPAFAGMSETQMLHPGNDITMRNALAELGFDVNEPIEYVPNKHRDRHGNVAVGFRAVGHIDPNNRKFLNSRLADNYDRMVAAGRAGDYSLAYELASLMCVGSPMRMLEDDAAGSLQFDEDTEANQEPFIEEDYETVKAQLEALRAIRDAVRPRELDEWGKPFPLGVKRDNWVIEL